VIAKQTTSTQMLKGKLSRGKSWMVLSLRPCQCGSLSQRHGASSGCGWRRRWIYWISSSGLPAVGGPPASKLGGKLKKSLSWKKNVLQNVKQVFGLVRILWNDLISQVGRFCGILSTIYDTTSYTRVYPKVSELAAWSENCKWYSSLSLMQFVSQSNELCRHNPLCCFSASFYCCCCCCLFNYD